MIERITIDNFKSLRKVDLTLGPLNFFVGTNASGKSNLFDALRVLWGIAGGNPLKEFLEGGPGTDSGEEWPGIRGGLAHVIYKPPQPPFPEEAKLRLWLADTSGGFDYSFAFNSRAMTTDERLIHAGREIFSFERGDAWFRHLNGGLSQGFPARFRGSQMIADLLMRRDQKDLFPVKDLIPLIGAGMSHVTRMQFLELEPRALRQYGLAADPPRPMGRSGENFAGVVRSICADPKTKAAYLSWLQELRPREVDDVKTLNGALGEPLFALSEGGQDFPAPVLSDGTLRFAALAASFFQQPPPELLAVEEIENGIHGSRLRLLVELFRCQAALGQTQIIATTHSPLVLAWLRPQEYQTTFLCKRDEMTGEARVLPLTEIPHFEEVIRNQSITELLTEGWMEAAL